MLSKIKGQDRAIALLRNAVKNDKLANSYLFYGPEGVGKFTTALYFGMMVNCHATLEKRPCGLCPSCKKFLNLSHPDLMYIFPTPKLNISIDGEVKSEKVLHEYEAYLENKKNTPWREFFFSQNIEIRIDSIRMLEHRIMLSPNEGLKKVYIIEDADLINREAANAFLKTLEEPPNDTIIILTTKKPNVLLPTIISRCQKIPFLPISNEMIIEYLLEKTAVNEYDAKLFARIANGNMAKALRLTQDKNLESRDNFLNLLQMIIEHDDLKFISFVDHYRSQKDQKLINEMISLLMIWLGDIVYLQNDPEKIVNLDQKKLLKKFYKKNPEIGDQVSMLTEFLEKMKLKLFGHVNPQLILIEIYNHLSKFF